MVGAAGRVRRDRENFFARLPRPLDGDERAQRRKAVQVALARGGVAGVTLPRGEDDSR